MKIDGKITEQKIRHLLAEVNDPEIPVVNIIDLGIVRDVTVSENICITITPTYSGCPAMQMIEADIAAKLKENGIENFLIKTTLSPPWTTDWISAEAKKKLFDFGIAPPHKSPPSVPPSGETGSGSGQDAPKMCPLCGSSDTTLVSAFGSTPCKALYVCKSCSEPFDYFKCH